MSKVKIPFMSAFLIGFVLLGCEEAWGTGWKAYGDTDDGLFYYDTENIFRLSKSIVRVWNKMVFSEKGIISLEQKVGKGLVNLSVMTELVEIDCVEKNFYIMSYLLYSKEGQILDSFVFEKPEWHFIPPHSVGERLYENICK